MNTQGVASVSAAMATGARTVSILLEQWRKGLLDCLPRRVRSHLAAKHAVLTVSIESDEAAVLIERGDHRSRVGRFGLGQGDDLGEAIEPFRKLKPSVVVRLPGGAVVTRAAVLPAQVKKNLRNALAFEIDRLTPFQREQVYFDYRLLPRESNPGKIALEVAACLREQVDPWIDLIRRQRLVPTTVAWDGAWASANLLPPTERNLADSRDRLVGRALIAFVLLLGVGVAISPLWQKRDEVIGLLNAVAEVRPKAERVFELRKQIDQARQQVELAATQKNREPRLVDLLKELTERLADDTYVQNLEYTRGSTQLRGESGQATTLIRSLTDTPGIDAVTFQSPVVQVPNSTKERFHISFQYTRPGGK